MRLGFDAKRLILNRTGLGNYSRTLVSELYERYPQNEYHLYSPSSGSIPLPENLSGKENIHLHVHGGKFSSVWRTAGIKKDLLRDRIQLYHGLSNEIPVGLGRIGIKSVVTIHDLIFKRYPGFFPLIDRKIYDVKFRYACQHADHIIAVSHSTAADIKFYYGIDDAKISVIYQACDPAFNRTYPDAEIRDVLEKHSLPDHYILYVGSVIPRKNLMQVVQGMALLEKKDWMPLVVAGSGSGYMQKVKKFISQNGLGNLVYFRNDISNADLPKVYQAARCFVYPSFYEGFGLPIQEALLSGVPVIAARTSSLVEAGGPKSLYIDPGQPQQMAGALKQIFSDNNLRQEMQDTGRQYAGQHKNVSNVEKINEIYTRIIKNTKMPQQ